MKIARFVLLSALAVPPPLLAQPPSCERCPRLGKWESFDTNAADANLETSFRYLLMQTLIDDCFHFWASGARDPEYLFRVSYHDKLEESVKSRLKISVYFNGPSGDLVKTWVTETDRPTAAAALHQNRMFNNDDAVLKAFRPIDFTLLNDFEKRPYQCAVVPAKESVTKNERIQVAVSKIQDINGKPSREFNRVIVQALDGEILGGVALESDEKLKAFQVKGGTITFAYKAPANCRAGEDTINVYNSCEVLGDNRIPMARTGLKDKIAEKRITIRCGEGWSGTLEYRLQMGKTADYSTEAIKNTTTIAREEGASVTVALEFTNRSGGVDYYRLASLSGSFSLKFDKVSENVEKNLPGATPRTILSKADCSAPLSLEDASLILAVNESGKSYALTADIDSPECRGTMTVSGGPASPIVERIHASIPPDFEGATDGKVIQGRFEPAQPNGKQTWSWRLRKD